MSNTLRDIGEFGLIERVTRALPRVDAVVVGVGDDCAVLRSGGQLLLVSCDASVEGIHFRRETTPPEAIGFKAAAAAFSDIAAMGGRPRFALVALACPADTPLDFLDALFRGITEAASEAGAVVVGGDTTGSPHGIFLDVTVIGEPDGDRYLCRTGAMPGDVLAVTGTLGRSRGGLLALELGFDAPPLVRAHQHPEPRYAEGQWLAAQPAAHAMIDLSDGLLQDAGHLAEAAGLGIDINPNAVPVAPELLPYQLQLPHAPRNLAMTSGEEYQLIVALDASASPELCTAFAARFGGSLTPIGSFTTEWPGVRVSGQPPESMGFDHFR